MRSPRPALLALVAFSLLFWSASRPASSQDPGALTIATDYELYGASELSGGGHVTWTLTGDEAVELRAKIAGLFDEYVTIPRGFAYAGPTGLVGPNGRIDREEALAYTALMEQELEGTQRGFVGVQVGYFRMDRADLFEAGVVERSTTGLVGTNRTTTEDLQIRFLFNGKSTLSDARFILPTRAFADALHGIFSFQARQFPGLSPDPWPFLAEGGWHVVTVDGRPAFWHGNDTTRRYEDGAVNTARTEPASASVSGLDLRFATTARLDFSFRGRVADPNDFLRLEAALGPAYTTWSDLAALVNPSGVWTNRTVDLSAFVGEQVRLRWNFTSDSAGNEEGFYVRDLVLRAPSVYEGRILESASHFLIGTLSFSDPSVNAGTLNVIRTPGGEILFYNAAWPSDASPTDAIRFQILNPFENPQALFAIMVIAGYFISRSQEVAYDRFRRAQPNGYRSGATKAKWLHGAGKAATGVLILLYFVPTALFNIGVRVFVSGVAYSFLALILAVTLGFGTRAYYRQRLQEAVPASATGSPSAAVPTLAPEQPVAYCAHCLREVLDTDRTYQCTCGSLYHLSCASDLMKCSNCRKPVSVELVSKRRSVSLRCASCGEVQTLPEDVDPRTVLCEACGGRLRGLDEGRGYLVVASNPAVVFSWLQDLTKAGRPGLCLTASSPKRLKLEYPLTGVEFIHVSAHGADVLDPKELDPAGLRPILSLSRAERGGVIVYDGLDHIVNDSSLGDVVRFIRKANDMSFVHGITVIARVSPGILVDSDVQRLSAEFDETIDLTARL